MQNGIEVSCRPCTLCKVRLAVGLAVCGLLGIYLLRRDEPPSTPAHAAAETRAPDRPDPTACPASRSPADEAAVRRDAVEEVLGADQWAIVPSIEPMLEQPRDRVAVVRALAARGLQSFADAREHPTVWLVRSTLLALLQSNTAAAAAIRRIDTRGTWRADGDAIELELTDQLVREIMPAIIEQHDEGSARALRALVPVRDSRTAERARSVLERALRAARADADIRVIETAIRGLDRMIRRASAPFRFRDPYFVESVAGRPDPDDSSFGLLESVPRDRLARIGPVLLRALTDTARRHPVDLPPPPPMPSRRPLLLPPTLPLPSLSFGGARLP